MPSGLFKGRPPPARGATRRRFLLSGATLIGLTACGRVAAQPLESPESFGVRSGPLSRLEAIANTRAMKAALEAGVPIDGRGRSYDMHGELRVFRPVDMRNMTLRQRSDNRSLQKFVLMDGLEGVVRLTDVTIDVMGLAQSAGMSQCSALQISHCQGAALNRVIVKNGRAISGVKIIATPNARLAAVTVRDFSPRFDAEPRDDVCQAIEIQQCAGFQIIGAHVQNLVATWPGKADPSREYSRGIVCGQSVDGQIRGNSIGPGVEQGIDITGSPNRRIDIAANQVLDNGTYGIKCANAFNDITIRDNTVVRAGLAGITCSAASDRRHGPSGQVLISGNSVLDTGASGLWAGSEPAGILLFARAESGPGHLIGITARGNRIVDRQARPTMVRGLDALLVPRGGRGEDAVLVSPRGAPPNREMENEVVGQIVEARRGWTS